MKLSTVTLKSIKPALKIGDICDEIQPNVTESCFLADPDGTVVGLFLTELPPDLQNLVNIADNEVNSDRVPKSVMSRVRPDKPGPNGEKRYQRICQYSAILGSTPPKPHMRRPYASRSSIHAEKSATTFVKAMFKAGTTAFALVQELAPELAASHTKCINQRLPEKWRFAKHFSSTISNCNISAPVHQDHANVKGAVNLIITKRRNSTGGNLHVPEYGATFGQSDNSLLVYPAWRNMHGVTPIVPTHPGGYRNSHVWYALDSFASLG
jgi:hypothetical protein